MRKVFVCYMNKSTRVLFNYEYRCLGTSGVGVGGGFGVHASLGFLESGPGALI